VGCYGRRESREVGREEVIICIGLAVAPLTQKILRKTYHTTKDEWCGVPEVFDRADTLEVPMFFPTLIAVFIFRLGTTPYRRRLP
jgi:hypothetical protein